jgi:DMSO reductase anchor subunit
LYALTSLYPVGVAAFGAGLAAVFSSTMVYVVTRRRSWRLSVTGTTFVATMAMGGLAFSNVVTPSRTIAMLLATTAAITLFARTASLVVHKRTADVDELRQRRMHLLRGELRDDAVRQLWGAVVAIVGAIAFVALDPSGIVAAGLSVLCAAAVVVAELAQRSLFFTTASPPR